jgi:hypothetical protein
VTVTFDDSIENNLEIIRELLRGLPPETRNQARLAASLIEKTFTAIQKDSQGNRGAALGSAFAIYMLAQTMVEKSHGEGKDKSLIELLN